MIDADAVKKLAHLSRLAVSDEEVARLQGEITSILAYIDTIQKVPLSDVTTSASAYLEIENVMRADDHPHDSGVYTETLLAQAPRRDGDYVKVKTTVPQ